MRVKILSLALMAGLVGAGLARAGTLFNNLDVPESFKSPKQSSDEGKNFKRGKFTSNGTEIFYVSAGDHGPFILMVHGFADYWYGWRDQIRELSKSYRVVALDLPGFDQSAPGENQDRYQNRYKEDLITADFANLLDQVGAKRAYLMGHDLGGWLAWKFAMKYPLRTAGVIALNSPHPRGYTRELSSNPKQKESSQYLNLYRDPSAAGKLSKEDLSLWVPERNDRTKYQIAMNQSSLKAMLAYYQNADLSADSNEKLPALESPALVILGMKDEQITPETLSGTWNWTEAPLTLITLPDVKHDVQREKPDWLNREVSHWIDDQEAKKQCQEIDSSTRYCVEEVLAYAPDGYRVKAVDLDGDGLPDLIHIGGPVSWFSSHDGSSHFISGESEQDFIDIAPKIMGGKPRLAVAGGFNFGRTSDGGELWLFTPSSDIRKPWERKLIDEVPTLHRLQWIDVFNDGSPLLLGSPLFGKGAKGIGFEQPAAPLLLWQETSNKWKRETLDESLHGIHGMEVVNLSGPHSSDILVASMEGITLFKNKSSPGKASFEKNLISKGDLLREDLKGAGEVSLGRNHSEPFIASIEPWHGDQVVIYDQNSAHEWKRKVIDHESTGGHSILTLPIGKNQDDAVIACFFGKNPGVYLFQRTSKEWKKTELIGAPFDCEGLHAVDLHGTGNRGVLAISDVAHTVKYLSFEKSGAE